MTWSVKRFPFTLNNLFQKFVWHLIAVGHRRLALILCVVWMMLRYFVCLETMFRSKMNNWIEMKCRFWWIICRGYMQHLVAGSTPWLGDCAVVGGGRVGWSQPAHSTQSTMFSHRGNHPSVQDGLLKCLPFQLPIIHRKQCRKVLQFLKKTVRGYAFSNQFLA